MKKLLLLFPIFLLAYEVTFTKVYKEYIIPKKEAIFIKTKATLTFPFKFFKVKEGYILVGDINEINMWLNNNFYAPDDAEFKTIKVAIINRDKIQLKIINQLLKTYKKCDIKRIEFLTEDEEEIITKPKTIKEKFKITLKCER